MITNRSGRLRRVRNAAIGLPVLAVVVAAMCLSCRGDFSRQLQSALEQPAEPNNRAPSTPAQPGIVAEQPESAPERVQAAGAISLDAPIPQAEIELPLDPRATPEFVAAVERVPIHPWHTERVENIRSETIEQVVENLANFDDMHFVYSSLNGGFCPGDMHCEVRVVVRFFRVRRLYEDGLRNPGRVIPLLKDAYRKAHEEWPQARAARLEYEKNNKAGWSEPDGFNKVNTRAVASTYLLAELQDHDSLPLLVAGFKLQRKWTEEMEDFTLTEVPVPRPMTLYAIHRLVTTLPQGGLSTKALAARRAYMTWAEKNLPEPQIKKVTAWYADYDESDPYRRIVDPKGHVLAGQPAIRLARYPHQLLDGTVMRRGHLPEEKKKEAEWAGLLLPFVEAVEDF